MTTEKKSDVLTPGFRKYAGLGLVGPYTPRKKQPGEALPPAGDLFARPVYVPERDNNCGWRKTI